MSLTDSRAESKSSTPPKPYSKPHVVSYGHVKDIVQGGGGALVDAGGAMSKACWVAEAIYGEFNPRTTLLRAWLADAYDQRRRWWFLISFYQTYGRKGAGLIRSGRLP